MNSTSKFIHNPAYCKKVFLRMEWPVCLSVRIDRLSSIEQHLIFLIMDCDHLRPIRMTIFHREQGAGKLNSPFCQSTICLHCSLLLLALFASLSTRCCNEVVSSCLAGVTWDEVTGSTSAVVTDDEFPRLVKLGLATNSMTSEVLSGWAMFSSVPVLLSSDDVSSVSKRWFRFDSEWAP